MEDGEEARISYRNDIVLNSFSIGRLSIEHLSIEHLSTERLFTERLSIKISFSSIKTVYRRAVYLKHPSVVS
jgi:hypothetical protein